MLGLLAIIMQCSLMKRLTVHEEYDVFVSVPDHSGSRKRNKFAGFSSLKQIKCVVQLLLGVFHRYQPLVYQKAQTLNDMQVHPPTMALCLDVGSNQVHIWSQLYPLHPINSCQIYSHRPLY